LSQSNHGHNGEFSNPIEDLDNLVQASQALEMLGEKYNTQEVCTAIKKNQKSLQE